MGVAYEDAALVGIREIVEGVDVSEYGLFCPVPNPDAADDIMREAHDGERVESEELNGFAIRTSGETSTTMVEAEKIHGRLLITDSRVAVACSKFDKSGNWTSVGGLAGKAMAAHRSKGKMMVSHVRYPWLAGVYARNRDGFGTSEMVRLVVDLSSVAQARVFVNLYLPKQSNAMGVATEIIRRAASFRLENEPDLDSAERAEYRDQLLECQELPQLEYQRKSNKLSGVSFVRHWYVDSRKAVLFGTDMTEVPQINGGFQGFEPA